MRAIHAICLALPGAVILHAASLSEVRTGAKRDLQESLTRLSQLRQQVEREKTPLAKEVNALEREARQKREEYERRIRLRDNREASLLELEKEVDEQEAELAADLSLLRDYVRSWRNGLGNPEKNHLANELADALETRVSDTNDTTTENLAATLRATKLSLKALQDSFGGRFMEGEAIVPPEGRRMKGNFFALGPITYFTGMDGTVGIVEKTISSEEDETQVTPSFARGTEPCRILVTPEKVASSIREGLVYKDGKELILPLDPTLGKALIIETGEPTLVEELKKGGIWIYPIIAFAAISVLIAFFKAFQILLVREPRRPPSLEGQFSGPFEALRAAASKNMGRKAEVLEEILYERIIDAQVRLEKALPLVAVTAATAPLLGLLGTVTGMIDVFRQITNFANPESSELARGISEALVTTKFGLITAIPALIIHALLSRRLQGLVAKMETFASRLVNLAANGNADKKPDEANASAMEGSPS
jgi:biopolymer transport protein ExbB